jgi:hypothetical protein
VEALTAIYGVTILFFPERIVGTIKANNNQIVKGGLLWQSM